MQRKYRKGKQLGLWVSDEVAGRLGALSKRLGLPQSQLLREALDLLFARHERPRKNVKNSESVSD
jgi:predicted DNA-binding protein